MGLFHSHTKGCWQVHVSSNNYYNISCQVQVFNNNNHSNSTNNSDTFGLYTHLSRYTETLTVTCTNQSHVVNMHDKGDGSKII